MKIITALLIMLLPVVAFSSDLSNEREQYLRMSWDMFTAGRICFENYSGTPTAEQLETCLKVQHTCKTVYDGIYSDERRRWLAESESVKKYITSKMLEPLDYCEILKLMSLEQKKVEEEKQKSDKTE